MGIFPPLEIREELAKLTIGLPEVKWVEVENFHITLQFLGDLEDSSLPSLIESLSEIQFSPFTVYLEGISYFQESRSLPVWISVTPKDSVIHLKSEIDKSLRKLNLPTSKNYTPHLTLGRIKKFHESRWFQYLETFQDFRTNEFEVNSFELIKSTLTPSGSIYEVVEEFSFG
ncbi:MAG: RNA 2',3'-cyclic phosphodiesterase [Leptospiraceae bacterium]|nr:RNA 2',3'-cyclic phosphodiesterase [Leptospiraceae bacterium]